MEQVVQNEEDDACEIILEIVEKHNPGALSCGIPEKSRKKF